MFLSFLLPTCVDLTAPEDDGFIDAPEIAGPSAFWALVHPTDAPESGSGVYRVDADGIAGPLPLPETLTSPHALFDDGLGLVVGGFVEGGDYGADAVFRLDYDGTVLHTYPFAETEGVTGAEGALYGSGAGGWVHTLAAEGSSTPIVEVESVVQDIAVLDGTLFVLTNSASDIVRAYDLDDPVPRVVTQEATFDNTGYAMMAWEDHLVLADEDAGGQFLHHLDASTGETLGITRVDLEGWITAVAPVTP